MISTLLKKYSHVNWALADQAMVSGVNFLTGILFARFLGLEEYGRFTLAWMAVLFFNSFQQAGIIAPMMSIGPKQEPDNEAVYYGAVFIHQIIWSIACFFLLWLGVWLSGFLKPEWRIQDLALPLAASLLAWQLQDFLRRYYFVRGLGGLAFLNDAVSYLGQLILLIVLFRLMILNTALVLWLIAGTSTLAVVAGLFKIGRITSPSGKFSEITRNHWRFSKWMMASALMQWFSGNFFFVAAGSVLGPVAVGGIKAAQNIIGVTHILFQAMENFAPSGAARAVAAGGISSLTEYLRKLTVLGISATGGIALIAWCFPYFFLTFLYGTEYGEYAVVLRWFCVIYSFGFLSMPLSAGLRAVEKTRPLFSAVFYAGLFSMVTAYPLVEWLGLHGPMLGLLITRVSMAATFFVSLRSYVSSSQNQH